MFSGGKLERWNVRNLAQLPLLVRFMLTNTRLPVDLAAEDAQEGLEAFEDVLTIEEEPGNWYVTKSFLFFIFLLLTAPIGLDISYITTTNYV